MPKRVFIFDSEMGRREELAAFLEDDRLEVLTESDPEWAVSTVTGQALDVTVLRGVDDEDIQPAAPLVEELLRGEKGGAVPVITVGEAYSKAFEGASRGGIVYKLAAAVKPDEVARSIKEMLGIGEEKEVDKVAAVLFEDERFVDKDSRGEKEEVDRRIKQAMTNAELARGSLTETPFSELAGELFQKAVSGAIFLRSGERSKIVFLRQGRIVTVKSNMLSECLGKILVREKMVSEEECEESLRRMRDSKRKQGTILVEMGCISPHNLAYAINKQLEEKLFDLFGWTEGEFVFDPAAEAPTGASTIELGCATILAEGVRQHMSIESVAVAIEKYMQARPRPGANALCPPHEILVDESDEEFFKALCEGKPISTLLDEDPTEKVRQVRLACALKVTGNIEFGTAKAARDGQKTGGEFLQTAPEEPFGEAGETSGAEEEPAKEEAISEEEEEEEIAEDVEGEDIMPEEIPLPELKGLKKPPPSADSQLLTELKSRLESFRHKDYFDVLGVPRTAGAEQIQKAYFDLARQHHPEKHFRAASLPVRAVAEELYGVIITAYEVLSDEKERQKYLKKLTGQVKREISKDLSRLLLAEGRFQEGENHLRKGRFEMAYRCFKEATELFPAEAEYRAYLGYSLFRCAPSTEENVNTALHSIRASIEANPNIDKSYLFLGFIYRQLGRSDMAEDNFRRAQRINPDCMKLTGKLGAESPGGEQPRK